MEWHHGVPEGIEFPDRGKFRRNCLAIDARMPDLIDTHVGQFVACFGDGQQFAFAHDLEEVCSRRSPQEELPTVSASRPCPRVMRS